MNGTPTGPLAGRTVGVTAARRAEELATMLERRGATVVHGPALRSVALTDDAALRAVTEALIAEPPDVTVITTGVGMRGWSDAAQEWGLGAGLRAALGGGTVLARGPKARGAVQACGLGDAWSPASESSAEVLDHLLDRGVAGQRVAVQQHGEPMPELVDALRGAGADVVEAAVYRWAPPLDVAPLDALLDAALAGRLDAVTFTSAPAALGMLTRAAERGVRDDLLAALRGGIVVSCVGPVTAAPLVALDVPVVMPVRSRLGALVRHLEAELTG